ncbi:Chitinase-3-like protein 2 [Onygenales sp. PD_12]|nr:Chitinase-3-like protein 2 [Onygenales sp. PD_12]KAK2796556.1 Chitinase-3-like protein 2 [Onygenales sp. PD_10]
MRPVSLILWLLGAQLASARFCMYIDMWNNKTLPARHQTEGIDCVILGFADSESFLPGNTSAPFMPFKEIRALFAEKTKLLFAVGGWSWSEGFTKASKTDESRKSYAKRLNESMHEWGFDGIDIDWEYPGGRGFDSEEKKDEITTYPLFLKDIRAAIGPDKLLSIAVPGKEADMLAYTVEKGKEIWDTVDFVNLMTYDLLNRYDNTTGHHSSLKGSLATVEAYKKRGLPTEKMNLGFSFYAKYFSTVADKDCSDNILGCPLAPMEENGTDNGASGAFTFAVENMIMPPKIMDLPIIGNGNCGLMSRGKCGNGTCCSSEGSCGNETDYCGLKCLPYYGRCNGATAATSFLKALADGVTDEKDYGHYYWDSDTKLFWTFETPDIMAKKFEKIVSGHKLGGVMAWSLGQDSFDWRHLRAMQEGVKKYNASLFNF